MSAKQERQRMIDAYLAETGRNMFVAGEFVDWLSGRPEHPVHALIFRKDDADAAREYRIDLVRRMTSGLRIVARVEEKRGRVVSITTREYPAFVSPLAGRRSGGGYVPLNPDDHDAMRELVRQGKQALQSWLHRYGAAMEQDGADLAPVRKIAAGQPSRVAVPAA